MSYNINSFVNKDEANALKEMIFQRARERAQAMNENVQTDVMDIARESFVSKNNPFSQIIENAKEKTAEPATTREKKNDIGFPQRTPKPRAVEEGRVVAEQATSAFIQNNMIEAREALANKKSFMGALNFLNAQGAVSLMRTRADKFDIVV